MPREERAHLPHLPIVFVITDKPKEWRPITEKLQQIPAEVKTISPQEILLRVDEWMPDVVLLDAEIQSPPIHKVSQMLKKNERSKHIDIIAVAPPQKAEKLYKFGVDLCLSTDELKSPDNLFRLVQRWLSLLWKEEKLQQKKANLEKINQSLLQQKKNYAVFVGSLSHEIRTPLGIIEGFVTNLLDELLGPLNPEQKQSVEVIHRQIKKLNQYLNEILDQSKIEVQTPALEDSDQPAVNIREEPSQRRRFRRRFLSLREIVNDAVELFSEEFKRKNLQLKVELHRELPKLWMDPIKIRQLLINLLSNAVKYTPSGGSVTVSAAPASPDDLAQISDPLAKRKGSFIKLSVRDTGVGIPKDKIPHLFEEFVQGELLKLDPNSPPPEGSGLGLAICKQIADEHGGSISIQSQEGQGTEVTVFLPTDLRRRKSDIYVYPLTSEVIKFLSSPEFPKDKVKKLQNFKEIKKKILELESDLLIIYPQNNSK